MLSDNYAEDNLSQNSVVVTEEIPMNIMNNPLGSLERYVGPVIIGIG